MKIYAHERERERERDVKLEDKRKRENVYQARNKHRIKIRLNKYINGLRFSEKREIKRKKGREKVTRQ